MDSIIWPVAVVTDEYRIKRKIPENVANGKASSTYTLRKNKNENETTKQACVCVCVNGE